jgi:hypothetical protein
MPSFISSFLWKHVFTAFLPPLNPDDVDYYTILSLDASPAPSTDDIRKAYRKLSLELHPDKIAQRAGGPEEREAARIKYEAVQQAYGTFVKNIKGSVLEELENAFAKVTPSYIPFFLFFYSYSFGSENALTVQ